MSPFIFESIDVCVSYRTPRRETSLPAQGQPDTDVAITCSTAPTFMVGTEFHCRKDAKVKVPAEIPQGRYGG